MKDARAHTRLWSVKRLAVLVSLAAAAPAQAAGPEITSLTAPVGALVGQPVVIALEARDPAAPVNGVQVSYPDLDGGWGETACVPAARRSRVPGSPGAGERSRFSIPYVPQFAGVHALEVTVISGECGSGTPRTASRTLLLTVSLPSVPGSAPPPRVPVFPFPDLGALLPAARAAQATCRDADARPAEDNLVAIRRATVCLINHERTSRGLRKLSQSRRLRRAATGHAGDMRTRSYFAHEGPDGPALDRRLRRVRYWPATAASENLAWGQGALSTPRQIVAGWMASDGHRANILAPVFREVGVAVLAKVPAPPPDHRGATYVANFGRK